MVKHTRTNFQKQKPTNCLSVFDHFVGLVLEGLILSVNLTNQFFFLLEQQYHEYICISKLIFLHIPNSFSDSKVPLIVNQKGSKNESKITSKGRHFYVLNRLEVLKRGQEFVQTLLK